MPAGDDQHPLSYASAGVATSREPKASPFELEQDARTAFMLGFFGPIVVLLLGLFGCFFGALVAVILREWTRNAVPLSFTAVMAVFIVVAFAGAAPLYGLSKAVGVLRATRGYVFPYRRRAIIALCLNAAQLGAVFLLVALWVVRRLHWW